jgi:hypothetical protein
MPDPRLFCEQLADTLLQHPISIGHAFVLAKMFQPGFDQERLQK